MNSSKLIYWFEELGKEHNDVVGKKCANLGEMTRMGLPVPPGFAISIDMYKKFIEQTGIDKEISQYIRDAGELKGKGITVFEEVGQTIRGMIEGKNMPTGIEREIVSYYEELCSRVGIGDIPVSVRSAGTASRPGMFETYLNVKGKENLLDKVKRVWASAFTPRAIAFRANKDIPIDGDMLGVAVPKMVNARAAGICFTIHPITADASKIVIEANWGLGEGVVSGMESVDRFLVNKGSLEIVDREIRKKIKQVVNKEEGAEWEDVPAKMQLIPCLNNGEIKTVARLAKTLEERLGQAQDVEWAVDPDFPESQNIFLLQTRPVKVVAREPESTSERIADMIIRKLYK